MKRTIMTNTDTFEQPNTGANEESLRMVSAAPVGNEPVSDEELRPHILEGFIGQPRLKAQLQLSSMLLENVTFLRTISCLRGLRDLAKPLGHDCGQ